MKYGIFVHDPDGDSGDGVIVGPFRGLEAASDKADAILRAAKSHEDVSYEDGVECIVIRLLPGATAARVVIGTVLA